MKIKYNLGKNQFKNNKTNIPYNNISSMYGNYSQQLSMHNELESKIKKGIKKSVKTNRKAKRLKKKRTSASVKQDNMQCWILMSSVIPRVDRLTRIK